MVQSIENASILKIGLGDSELAAKFLGEIAWLIPSDDQLREAFIVEFASLVEGLKESPRGNDWISEKHSQMYRRRLLAVDKAMETALRKYKEIFDKGSKNAPSFHSMMIGIADIDAFLYKLRRQIAAVEKEDKSARLAGGHVKVRERAAVLRLFEFFQKYTGGKFRSRHKITEFKYGTFKGNFVKFPGVNAERLVVNLAVVIGFVPASGSILTTRVVGDWTSENFGTKRKVRKLD